MPVPAPPVMLRVLRVGWVALAAPGTLSLKGEADGTTVTVTVIMTARRLGIVPAVAADRVRVERVWASQTEAITVTVGTTVTVTVTVIMTARWLVIVPAVAADRVRVERVRASQTEAITMTVTVGTAGVTATGRPCPRFWMTNRSAGVPG